MEFCQLTRDMLYKGAVVADEHHHQGFSTGQIAKGHLGTIDIRQSEIGSRSSQG
jgi:hypothetical protein